MSYFKVMCYLGGYIALIKPIKKSYMTFTTLCECLK